MAKILCDLLYSVIERVTAQAPQSSWARTTACCGDRDGARSVDCVDHLNHRVITLVVSARTTSAAEPDGYADETVDVGGTLGWIHDGEQVGARRWR